MIYLTQNTVAYPSYYPTSMQSTSAICIPSPRGYFTRQKHGHPHQPVLLDWYIWLYKRSYLSQLTMQLTMEHAMAASMPCHSCTQGKLLHWHHRLTVPHTLKSGGLTHEDFWLRYATHCNTSVASVLKVFKYCMAGVFSYSYIQQRTPPESLLLPTTIPVD